MFFCRDLSLAAPNTHGGNANRLPYAHPIQNSTLPTTEYRIQNSISEVIKGKGHVHTVEIIPCASFGDVVDG